MQNRLDKLLRRVQQAEDSIELARLGDKELDELLKSGALIGAAISKVQHAKTIRSLFGADAALNRLQHGLTTLPDQLLENLEKKEETGQVFKFLIQKEIARRVESKRLNKGSVPHLGGVTDWWRE